MFLQNTEQSVNSRCMQGKNHTVLKGLMVILLKKFAKNSQNISLNFSNLTRM